MKTYFSGNVYSFDKRINWMFNFLSFLGPFLSSNFFKGPVLDILLPSLTFLLPLFSEFLYLIIRGCYFKQKLKFILAKKSYKISAIGMFIDSSFKVEPNEFNKEVQLSNKYIIEIFIEYNFWKASLKLIAKNSISNKLSSNSISDWVNVSFESKYLIKISYSYKNDFIDNENHKSKNLNEFKGVCNLLFDEKGEIIDYFYSSDGKNKYSFIKEWMNSD